MRHNWPKVSELCAEIQPLADILNRNSSLENSRSEILGKIVKSFDAESGNFCYHGPDSTEASREKTTLLNLSWRYTERYIDYFHHLDPFLRIRPDIGAFRDNDIMPRPYWLDSEFFVDFIKPQKVSHLLVMRVNDANHLIGHIGLFRAPSSPGFSSSDLFKAQYVSSMLSQNYRYQRTASRCGELEQLLDQVQKTSSIGIIVLDAELNLVYRNTKTLEFGLNLSAGLRDPLQVGNQIQLPDDIVQECLSLSASFRDKFHFKPENRHLVLRQNNHQMVDVDIITLPSAPNGNGHRKPYFVVLLEAIHRAGNPNNPVTVPGGKLTPKETEIARCI
ncbi:MAG TPA: hypothetical protein VF318_04125, partial [Dehalococcoidales bacterium]